jgi:23S rRNA-/tRNA-specific pseudouridylate synthase
MLYQDDHLYYLWKPADIPSTRGKQHSFLDMVDSGEYEHWLAHSHHEGYHERMRAYLVDHIQEFNLEPIENVHATLNSLLHTFSHQQEYGLLNRLDTPTAGFLYFAKNIPTYIDFKLHQKEERLIKHYLAKVDGHVHYLVDNGHDHDEVVVDGDYIHIYYPLMHHQHLHDRMVVLRTPEEFTKGRGQPMFKKTTIHPFHYNIEDNRTMIHITIESGARHQIRAHLSALGYPILGEQLYTKKKDYHHMPLHLWSIGCEIKPDEE